MLSVIGAILIAGGFIFFITVFNLVEKSRLVFKVSQDSLAIVRDPSLSDEEKEKAMQQSSKKLFALFFIILFIGGVAIFVPIGLIWLLDKAGLFNLQSAIARTLSWQFILAGTIVIMTAMWIKHIKQ